MSDPWVLITLMGTFGTVVAGVVIWITNGLGIARHAKDNELQEIQSQIDVLQIQMRELQLALGNGPKFTRTPQEMPRRR